MCRREPEPTIRLLCEGRRLVNRAAAFVFQKPSGCVAIDSNAMQTSVRIQPRNHRHHLWRNHGLWWCHFTVHHRDHTKSRIRRSTGTRHLEEARQIRDFLLTVLSATTPAV